MTDQEKGGSQAAQQEEKVAARPNSSSSGTHDAGTGSNPQDGGDSGKAGASRPRGQTVDPQKAL